MISLIYEDSGAVVPLDLDAELRESLRREVTLPTHPVEKGMAVADDVQEQGRGYELEGVVTNTPRTDGEVPSQKLPTATDALDGMLLGAESVTIATLGQTLFSMRLRRYALDRDSQASGRVKVALTFEQILVVESQVVKLPKRAPGRTKPKVDDGKQVATPASAATGLEADKSIWAHAWDGDYKLNPFAD